VLLYKHSHITISIVSGYHEAIYEYDIKNEKTYRVTKKPEDGGVDSDLFSPVSG
jgi:hypothetical protein